MTVAEQAAEMERYVAAFNALPQFAAKNQGKNLAVKHHGDPNTHIIYAVATYPKHVSDKQLANVKTTLTKIKAKENICAQPEMVALTSTGIGYHGHYARPIRQDIIQERCVPRRSLPKRYLRRKSYDKVKASLILNIMVAVSYTHLTLPTTPYV